MNDVMKLLTGVSVQIQNLCLFYLWTEVFYVNLFENEFIWPFYSSSYALKPKAK